MLEAQIEEILDYQTQYMARIDEGTSRTITKEVEFTDNHAKILTGIRRCGKSTAMLQIARRYPAYNLLSFEDPRLSTFQVQDFFKLEKIFDRKRKTDLFFFDEIQNVDGWEAYIRVLLDKRQKVVITGSNARILSKELGTSLTGRHISYEVYPFSYSEYLAHFNIKAGIESFADYLKKGGMPEFLNSGNKDVLLSLYNDLIYRDIVVRHNLRNPKTVNELGVYLATHVGKEYTYNRLGKAFDLGSNNTVASYISYFEDAYLFFSIPRFSYSLKQQQKNPRKIYGIDTGLIANLSMSFSRDHCSLLENIVFLQLKRLGMDISYFRNHGECDFIASKNRSTEAAFQVCYELNDDNLKREVTGLTEALHELGLKKGFILTYDQKDEIKQDGKKVILLPVWEWLTE
jgi:predicted AAA+ superfamily ATPase